MERALLAVPGVQQAAVNGITNTAEVAYDGDVTGVGGGREGVIPWREVGGSLGKKGWGQIDIWLKGLA